MYVHRLKDICIRVVQCVKTGYPLYTCVGEQGSNTTRVQSGTTVEHGLQSYWWIASMLLVCNIHQGVCIQSRCTSVRGWQNCIPTWCNSLASKFWTQCNQLVHCSRRLHWNAGYSNVMNDVHIMSVVWVGWTWSYCLSTSVYSIEESCECFGSSLGWCPFTKRLKLCMGDEMSCSIDC